MYVMCNVTSRLAGAKEAVCERIAWTHDKLCEAIAELMVQMGSSELAVLREIMRLDTHFWARRVWVDFRKVLC